MAFKKSSIFPEFADLKGILSQTKEQTEGSLYQTVQEIIERLTRFKLILLDQLGQLLRSEDANKLFASRNASYITKDDDHVKLPNSVQMLAGTGISLDYSVPNKVTISTGSGSGYWAPLTDGDPDETNLIFADGECVMCFIPTP